MKLYYTFERFLIHGRWLLSAINILEMVTAILLTKFVQKRQFLLKVCLGYFHSCLVQQEAYLFRPTMSPHHMHIFVLSFEIT